MLVSATFTPMTATREEIAKAVETAGAGKNGKESESGEYLGNFAWVFCIQFPITFWKKSMPMSTLFDSDSEINDIYPTFIQELGVPIRPTDIEAQKIECNILDTYEIVVAAFSITDKANWVRFFEKTFLVANFSPEVVFGMLFLTFRSADIDFLNWELW